jgi:hypothetical protein
MDATAANADLIQRGRIVNWNHVREAASKKDSCQAAIGLSREGAAPHSGLPVRDVIKWRFPRRKKVVVCCSRNRDRGDFFARMLYQTRLSGCAIPLGPERLGQLKT